MEREIRVGDMEASWEILLLNMSLCPVVPFFSRTRFLEHKCDAMKRDELTTIPVSFLLVVIRCKNGRHTDHTEAACFRMSHQ